MNYQSTRDRSAKVSAARAIVQGISHEGGLFVPETLPVLTPEELEGLVGLSYNEKAKAVLSRFLTDFTPDEIAHCVDGAYNTRSFDTHDIAEISKVGERSYFLELWHGPTCAFKDMALQLLPYLMKVSMDKEAPGTEVVVLVATSGDTGKAALAGFADVPGTRMLVFYPENGVSGMQKLQMVTQEGGNVSVCAIKGNFDDAQSGVKAIFTDPSIEAELRKNGQMFSSANSINWGRLVPQIVYYVAAYTALVEQEEIAFGDTVNVCVPTGNFGNILAAYYAKRMGVPIGRLICASNRNNVLTDFIRTGVYDRNRDFYTTTSPSMDILISSNLERLLFHLSGEDDGLIRRWFASLAETGRYAVSPDVQEKLQAEFWGGFCDDQAAAEAIHGQFDRYGYLCDPHTAVAVKVYEDYVRETGDDTRTIIASTASPYKFCGSVLPAVTREPVPEDPFAQMELLHRVSGMAPPASLAGLKGRPVRFTGSIEKGQMADKVKEMLR